ncbi:scopoletin glucosyltransferase [Dendrobium catenatum]|uniref:scopoletin glucosyltransferase n=1 Tax=Dendrobium catenatum TaxID=906689 RepID=UPI00109F4794|nr:scopoletin glucosyltransferase [Dendrobium catenatum]
MAAAAAAAKEDHVIMFPFLSKGHTIPLLHLAAALSSRNILTTLITTPANLPFCRDYLSSKAPAVTVDLFAIPFPCHPDLPAGVESTDSLPTFSLLPTFIKATNSLHDPFLRILRRLLLSPTPPLCLISDYFLGWTLRISSRFGLPRLVFHGSSTFSISLIKSLWPNIPTVSTDDDTFPIVGAPPTLRLTMTDVPEFVRQVVNPLDPLTQSMKSNEEMDVGSWGVIVNSFAELEPSAYVKLLESFYEPVAGGRAWLVGPLNLLTGTKPVDSDCIRWLDRQPVGSVVYVAFGTQADVSDEQLDELAHGLMQGAGPIPNGLCAPRVGWQPNVRRIWGGIERAWDPTKG